MGDSLEKKLSLAQARCKRLKKARAQAENLLEQKSRELFEANQTLEATQRKLKEDIKQATYELNVTNKRLQNSLNERSAFIGQMSHEVRTPLNAIIGLSEILLTTKLDEAQSDYIDTINNGARSLIVLLNDMLDITKIEAGRVDINPQPESTHRIHKNIITMFTIEAKAKGLKLDFKIDQTVPTRISIDKGRYKQIINNLISNALKNTERGGVLVNVSYEHDLISEGMGVLKVKVVDTGVGIAEDQMERIFNAYEQIGRPNQGVGLGLAICQQLSELMMGKISCESKVGRGSIFELSLPVMALHDSSSEIRPAYNLPNAALPSLEILIAEDNPTNQKVISAQLSQIGQRADITNNGAEALEKLKTNDYDLVILDILMPVMNGEETIRSIRSSESRISQHYCIALTASSYEDQQERLLGLGFDAFLSKPLSLDQLIEALNDVPKTPRVQASFGGKFMEQINVTEEARLSSFDFSYLKTQFGDAHLSIFQEIAPTFLDHAYRELDQLLAIHAQGQNEKVKKICHSMKGAASSIGLNHLSNTLLQIESKADTENVDALVSNVEKIMSDLKPVITAELDKLTDG